MSCSKDHAEGLLGKEEGDSPTLETQKGETQLSDLHCAQEVAKAIERWCSYHN